MKKQLSLLMVAMSLATSLFALPVKPGQYKNITLADGSVVKVELKGDEHKAWWQSEDGRQFVLDADSYKQVKVANLPDKLPMPTAETAFAHRLPGVKPKNPIVGDRKGLIVLVQFTDVKFQDNHTPELYNEIANQLDYKSNEGYIGSVRDYFRSQSEGKLDYTFDIVGPVQLANNQKYYGGNITNETQKNFKELLKECITAIKDTVDFSKYDNDDDGEVDNIFFVYAGKNEADGGGDDCIWPHMYYFPYRGLQYTLNGVKLNIYACSSELQGDGAAGGIGAICHEFSHCLGLPDIYDTYTGEGYGAKDWSIMHSGCYLGNNFCPCGYTAYERWFIGWREPVELKDAATYSDLKSIRNGGDSYIMYNDYNTREYYIAEPRAKEGWDTYLPNSGLLIWHVDYKQAAWTENTVNNDVNHQRLAVVCADNNTKGTTYAGDIYPTATNDMITDETTPATSLFNANSDGTRYLHKSIYNIKKDVEAKTVSFSYMPGVYQFVNPDKPEGALFFEGFYRCAGTGGNDGNFGNGIATAAVNPDLKEWKYNKAYAGKECARFGTSSADGYAITPAFTINGEAVLTFKAAPFNNDPNQVELSVASGDATLDVQSFPTSKGKWTDCKATIKGTGEITLRFDGYNRFLLDEVLVMPAGTDAIKNISATSATGSAWYNLAGQQVGKDYKGIVISGGKKFIVK